MKRHKVVYNSGEGEIVEKKSRFIATVRPVKTEEEAVLFIDEMKKKYWNATHNCSAYVLGLNNEIMRCSDDGEPAQTAGRPMLDVLIGEEIRNVCVVVTRYFGGTLLGTGGLVRAYSKSVQEGLAGCDIIEKIPADRVDIDCDYTLVGKLQYLIAQEGITVLDTVYTDKVNMSIMIPVEDTDSVIGKITEAVNAKAGINKNGQMYYALLGKEVLLFEK